MTRSLQESETVEILLLLASLWLIGKAPAIGSIFCKPDSRSWPEKYRDAIEQEQRKKDQRNG